MTEDRYEAAIFNVITIQQSIGGEELMKGIKDNNARIMVVGSDWQGKKVIGEELVDSVLYFERIGDYSKNPANCIPSSL